MQRKHKNWKSVLKWPGCIFLIALKTLFHLQKKCSSKNRKLLCHPVSLPHFLQLRKTSPYHQYPFSPLSQKHQNCWEQQLGNKSSYKGTCAYRGHWQGRRCQEKRTTWKPSDNSMQKLMRPWVMVLRAKMDHHYLQSQKYKDAERQAFSQQCIEAYIVCPFTKHFWIVCPISVLYEMSWVVSSE